MKGADIESIEKLAWKQGIPVNNGKKWKVMRFDNVIGASAGKEARYMRVEFSSGTIHGYPITETEYLKLTR